MGCQFSVVQKIHGATTSEKTPQLHRQIRRGSGVRESRSQTRDVDVSEKIYTRENRPRKPYALPVVRLS
jgi:hypothetical protein